MGHGGRFLEVPEEPVVDLGDPSLDKREVAVLLTQMRVDARNLLCQPLAMLERHEPILSTVPEHQRKVDGPHIETPWMKQCPAVVPPSFDARREAILYVLRQMLRQLSRHHRGIRGGQQRLHELAGAL